MTTQKPFILIDGSSYLYRAYHALPPLTNSRGQPTGAIYGVVNMIRKLLNEYDPEYIAVIFDPRGRTHRDSIYAHYKAHRPPTPDELSVQVEPLFEVIKAMGLPLIIVEGEEADDVIGTLALDAEKQGMSVLISTGDKDLAQLVNDKISLINTMTGLVLDPKGVQEKFGVKPNQIIDYLALIGDSSDNIPGVPKVGPKTAAKWLEQYQTLDKLVENAASISGKIGENLRDSLAQLPLSKELVSIRSNLALPNNAQALKRKPLQRETLIELFQQLEFRGWLNELMQQGEPLKAEKQYKTIFTATELETVMNQLLQQPYIAFDLETNSLDAVNAEIIGASFSFKADQAYYVPVGHDYPEAPTQIPREQLIVQIKKLFAKPEMMIVGQHIKYDLVVLNKYGLPFIPHVMDTMLESYILNSASNRHDMDTLALKYLGQRTTSFEDIAGKGQKQVTFNQIHLDKASPYACQDADVTLQLHHTLWPKVSADKKLAGILQNIEIPLVPVLAKMEHYGVLIDTQKLSELSQQFGKRIVELETEAHHLAKKTFNLNSPKQLQEILYVDLKIPAAKKTPTGQPSTAEEVLQELALDYPLPKVILEFRGLSKLKSTYTDGLVAQKNERTGRVHTSYNQAITSTGRLSSTEPNLQNIPIRMEEGRKIRQAFIAPKGQKIVAADYSQIELRIMAHLSQDKSLLHAFANSKDVHRATAAEIFSIAPEIVTSEQRRSAKVINFGLIYGMSAFGLARALGVERNVAQAYMDLYFARYPGVKNYMDRAREIAHKQGYVETILGRRLYLPEINVSNLGRRRAAERAAINAPMQGTAADIIKLAMIAIDRWITNSNLKIKMIMQVHDELVFEIAETDVALALPLIRQHMIEVMQLDVPLEVDIGIGNNWDEAH